MKYPKRSPYLIYRRYGDEYIVENWIWNDNSFYHLEKKIYCNVQRRLQNPGEGT